MEREKIYIHLNSEYADITYNDNNCDVLFYIPLVETTTQSQILLSIDHFSIPNSFYNVNQYNNLFKYRINNVDYNFYISVGNYTIYNLVDYLNANLTNFTFQYNKIKNTLTITHSSSDFTILSSSTCLKILGLSGQISSFGRTLSSTKNINLIYTNCICIYTNIDTDSINKSMSLNNKTILTSIPIDVAKNNLIIGSIKDLKVNTYKNTLSEIRIQLCSQTGQILDLNGLHWTMTIILEFYDFVND
jgi:hypothetical protein